MVLWQTPRKTLDLAQLFGDYDLSRRTNAMGNIAGRNTGADKVAVWWEWELEFSSHLLKRMTDRQFTEVDLRRMLERAKGFRPDIEEGRWVIDVRHKRKVWGVIVEPDMTSQLLVIVTAYPVEELKP